MTVKRSGVTPGIGDVVQLNSGSIQMTVVGLEEGGKYLTCYWHTRDGYLCDGSFPIESVMLCVPAARWE